MGACEYHEVTVREGEKGNLWQDQPYHSAAPGYLGRVLTECSLGY